MGSHGLFTLLLSLLLSALDHVHAQPGFISIDCGKDRGGGYSNGGISYVPDFDFIDTGEIHKVASSIMNSNSVYYPHAYDLRSFPSGIRNCYNIKPLTKGNKYLIRAFFLYGNYDGLNHLPQFDLHLGVNLWARMAITNASINHYREIMATASSDKIDVCLVNTGSGTPFISALELRPLPDSLYTQVNASQSLVNWLRVNDGGSTAIRYKDDIYDRIWRSSVLPGWETLTTASYINTSTGYDPPLNVMQTSVYPSDGSSLNFSWSRIAGVSQPSPRYYIVMHFSELQQLQSNESRTFYVYLNGNRWSDAISPKYLETTTLYNTEPEKSSSLEFSIVKANGSTMPPIINAAELFVAVDMKQETDSKDVDAIMYIKESFKLQRNWMGDPCAPKSLTWNGVNCSFGDSGNYRIITLNLSSSALTREIPTYMGSLTQLQTLDLSNNSLTGNIPDILGSLSQLEILDLSGNKFTGSIPKALKDRSMSGSLRLIVGDNPNLCNSDACDNSSKKKTKLVIIMVSAVIGSVVIILAIVLTCRMQQSCQTGPGSTIETQNEHNRKNSRRERGGSFRMTSLGVENKHFTFSQLVKITSDFRKEIGKGGFGPVYYGVLEDDSPVAVKILSHSSSQGPREFQNEAQLLTRVHHKNLVLLIGYCNDVNNLALVYEYMAEGNLFSHLSAESEISQVLSWKVRLHIAIEAAHGLEYLHNGCRPSIIHRDVKSSNILLNKNMEAKISDFGMSKTFENDQHSHVSTMVVGTLGYLDPEYSITNKLTEKSDVFSFGIVLLELVTGLPAIVRETEPINLAPWVKERLRGGEISEIVDKRLEGEYNISSVQNATKTALKCAAPLSIERPTMSEVLALLKDCMELEMVGERALTANQTRLDNNSNTSFKLIPPIGLDRDIIMNPPAR